MSMYRSRADDGDASLVGHLDHLPGLGLGDALSDDGDGVDLETQLNETFMFGYAL